MMLSPPISMRLLSAIFLLTAHTVSAAVIEHGPIVHWNQDPGKACRIVWLDRAGSSAIEGKWSRGPAGFGYGDGDDATQFSNMRGRFTSIAIRRAVGIPAGLPPDAALFLRVNYDDGFIAWLGGKEIARRNITQGDGPLRAANSHEAGKWEEIPLGKLTDHPKLAGAVLALRGFNNEIKSSDFTLHAELVAKAANREWPIIARGATWEYLANAEPENGWWNLTKIKPTAAGSASGESMQVRYRVKGDSIWKTETVHSQPFANSQHRVMQAELKGLPYGKDIEFEAIDINNASSGTYAFRMPPVSGPIRFVTGGDLYHKRKPMDQMNQVAGKQDPLFALIGGDLAYADDDSLERWFEYIDSWTANARTPDGRLIPKIVAIGNHEIKGHGFHPTDAPGPEAATMFYSIFTFPEGKNATHVVDIGSSLSLIQLDSGHTKNIADQNIWLERTLGARRGVSQIFVTYHRPAWGCGAKDDSMDIRRNWCPRFEHHRVSAVFESDHHVFSRSHPLLNGKIDPENGIPYLGSGAWSVAVRKVDPRDLKKRPWIASAAAVNHLYLIESQPGSYTATAIDIDGKAFDRFPRTWKR